MTNLKVAKNVIARQTVMLDALKEPANAEKRLVVACKTQEAFAALEMRNHRIFPVALNTLKAAADSAIENGGWSLLDSYRRQLYRAFSHQASVEKKKKKPRVDQLRDVLNIIEGRVETERRARIKLLRAYSDLITIVRPLAAQSEPLANQLDRHEATWDIRSLHLVDEEKKGHRE